MDNLSLLHQEICTGAFKALARAITLVENDLPGSEVLLRNLQQTNRNNVIGITGPPGAGKSTLINALAELWANRGKKICILAVDPSSPFNYGALLGDRIRMAQLYTNPNIYIRSLASRGALGGLSDKIIEVSDVAKEAGFDYIIVETVGVGQSEVEIAGLADCTIVTLAPEAGDEVQNLKAGLMEIADVFVVNKADRPGADKFATGIEMMLHERPANDPAIQVVKTIATENNGINELAKCIEVSLKVPHIKRSSYLLAAEKILRLTGKKFLKNTNPGIVAEQLALASKQSGFNLYAFVDQLYNQIMSRK